jgi:HEAT repeat protein
MEDFSVSAAGKSEVGGLASRFSLAPTRFPAVVILTLLVGTGRGEPSHLGRMPVPATRVVGGPQNAVLRTPGEQASLTVEDAIKRLADPNPKTRWQAARALRESGAQARAAVPVLAGSVDADASIDVRVEAILALGAIGKGSPDAVAALSRLIPKRDLLSGWAVIALGDSAAAAKDAVPTIVAFLDSATDPESPTDAENVILAIITLGRIGPSARAAIPAVEKHLGDTRNVPEWGNIGAQARRAVSLMQKND